MGIEDYTEEERKKLFPRDEKGRIAKGSKLGILKRGTKHGEKAAAKERKRLEGELNQRAQEIAKTMLNEKLVNVIDTLYEQAMGGDVKALALWMRHSVPTSPQAPRLVNSELLEEMQNEPPEQIIQSTVRAMAAGEVDVMLGKEIISACRASIEANFTDRFRRLMKKAQEQNLGIEQIMPDLISISEDIQPIELEALPHDDR